MVDPEIRDVEIPMWLIDPTYPRPWWMDPRVSDRPKNRREWFAVSLVSWIPSIPCFVVFINNLIGRRPALFGVSLFLYYAGYMCVIYVVYFLRESVPIVLRRSEKQLFESALVVVCSSWVYCMRDMDTRGTILGLILCFQVIPIMNLWWCFENVGSMDCCLIVLVEVAAFCCRGNGVLLTGVGGGGIALQLIKNAYRQYTSQKIKQSTEKHLI